MKAKDTVIRNKSYHCLEYDHDQMGEIFLVACGQEKCDPGVTYGPDRRDCYHLHIVRSGFGTLKIRGKTYHPGPNQMFLLKHNEIAEYTADRKDPWNYCWMTFHGSDAKRLVEEIGFTEGIYCLDQSKDPEEFFALIARINEIPELTPINDLRRKGILLEFLALCMEATQTKEKKLERRNQKPIELYIRKAEDFMRYNYATIQVSDVVSFIGFTRSYFYSVFKKQTGQSPQEYLLQIRLTRARQLLTQTDWRIMDIASAVGFEDSLHFSRLFHQKCGCSPSDYRAGLIPDTGDIFGLRGEADEVQNRH